MILDSDIMGRGQLWAAGLMSVDTYLSLQFWAATVVFLACVPQLHLARKFRYPVEPGRLSILGHCIGSRLHSARLALRLANLGACLDFAAAIIGRLGIALQTIVALFALDDVMSAPAAPRPMITFMLLAVAMIQARSLTAYSPRPRAPP